MDPRGFCTSTRLLIVAGKGGVGKTTVAAALARMAANAGLTTLLVEVEGRDALADTFGLETSLGYAETVVSPGGAGGPETAEIRARTITPEDALLEWLDDHGLRRISRRLVRTGAVDVVATAAPGIKDILVLGKVKQIERANGSTVRDPDQRITGWPVPDLILLDAPAAGHAVTFLQSANGLLDAVRVGPIRSQAQDAVELLRDPTRCQVMLVTLPEETPVNELVETAYLLEDRVGVQLAPVVVNGVYPPLDGLDVEPGAAARSARVDLSEEEASAMRAAAEFRRRRQALQAEQIARLADALPLPQIQLPYLFSDRIGPAELDVLADALDDGVRKLPEVAPAR